MTRRIANKIVRSAGLAVVDGLALTYSCCDYPAELRALNGWDVESAARAIHAMEQPR